MQKAKEAPAAGATGGAGIPPIPVVDFSRFGETEEVPMTRLMQIGAAGLHASWLNIPHVTQFDQADITAALGFFLDSPAVTGQMIAVDGGQHLGWQTPDVLGVE